MEILAPCGDEESFFAAVNNGADAIYLGLGDFNARAKSTFFTRDNIRDYVKLAHLFGVKVYVTTNTILLDNEISSFLEFAKICVDSKVDAFIIQDLAVAKIFKENFKNVVMHASTQMGIHNVSGAKIAKELGFTRVVLSRETKLDDIMAIKRETGLEIEYFVQGALCVSFSGNCYLSEFELGKSGNRGKCAQLCRLPYTAIQNGKVLGSGYLLSARDLCLIENLDKLQKAEVDSLKIEGRLRRAGYVAQCVQSYRKALDNVDFNLKQEKLNLKKVFSRGEFNNLAYLEKGTPNNIINPQIQNHLGIEIGKVIKTQPFKELTKIWISSSTPIHSGDGLKFLFNDKEQCSLGVGNVERVATNEYVIYSKAPVQKGFNVFLTLDSEHEKELNNVARKLKIDVVITAKQNLPLAVSLKCGEIFSKLESDYICPKATSSPTSSEELTTQFSKLNDTNFELGKLKIDTFDVFIPKSVINKLRRDAISKLQDDIINCYEEKIKAKFVTDRISVNYTLPSPLDNIYYFDENTDLTKIDANSLLCFNPLSYTLENVISAINKARKFSSKIGLNLPIIANGNDCLILEKILSNLPKDVVIVAQNIGHIDLVRKYNLTYIAGEHLNIANSLAASVHEMFGAKAIILSKEFDCNLNGYKLVKGNEYLMTFAHCPFKTLFNNDCKNCTFSKGLHLQGKNGHEFLIRRYQISQCYFTLKNSVTAKQTNSSRNVIDLT